MAMKPCRFCAKSVEIYQNPLNTLTTYHCSSHGVYALCEGVPINEPIQHIINGYLYETRKRVNSCILTTDNIQRIINDPIVPKTAMQKLNKILEWMYIRNNGFDGVFESKDMVPAIGYAKNVCELSRMLESLSELEYVTKISQSFDNTSYMLTIKGLTYAEALMFSNTNSNKVFVAMGFSPDLLDAHENAIKPACEELGFSAFIISEEEHNDGITDKIIAAIKTSRFAIVDFTYNNNGAYFEAGYAQGKGLPVIRTCKKGWFDSTDEEGHKNKLHFDISHYNIILWENEEDLKKRLIDRIGATIL
ncbi:MAG: hypothetical protein KK926_03735 [Methanomethylovorans sp.]|nr:hypothetical protein [Methanomethylovorans sp.]